MLQSEKWARWILLTPILSILLLLVVFPFGYILYSSMTTEKVGFIHLFDNYINILTDRNFWSALTFTLKYTAFTVIIQMVSGLALALLFNRAFYAKGFLLGLLMLPVMIAPSLMGIMYRLMLNENIGLVSHLFSMIGFELNLFRPDTIVPVIIILDTLQWTPFVVLILYSGLLGINHELYEVASVDGGTYWTIVFRIILPILTPIIIIAAFLRGIDAFRTFDLIHVLTNGGPGNATTNLSIYIYNIAFKHGNFALANSASVIVIIGLSVVLPFIVRRLTTID